MKKLNLLIALVVMSFSAMAENEPNGFIENKGQWPDEVEFLFRSNGMNAWITDFGVVYDFQKATQLSNMDNQHQHKGQQTEPTIQIDGHVVKMSLQNGVAPTFTEKQNESSHLKNYFLGNNASKWATDVKTFEEVILKDVYAGIDVRYYEDRGSLRYDFIVHPGANPNQIKWLVDGVSSSLGTEGQLLMHTSLGDVQQAELTTYQTIGEKKNVIDSRFTLNSNVVSFSIGAYDNSHTLIIDPIISQGGLGGITENDQWFRVQVETDEDNWFYGETLSADYPTTSGAYSTTSAGSVDLVISKSDADLSLGAYYFSTYIGGSGEEELFVGSTAVLSADGGLVFTATTQSADFPTVVGAFDNSYNGGKDAVVAKINATGTSLQFSTYYGGADADYGGAVTLDQNQNVYLAGITNATGSTYPVTGGAYDQTANGDFDIGITKFNSTCSTVSFSTLFGGNDYDDCYSMELDDAGNVVVLGYTRSTNLPAFGGYQSTLAGGNDAMVFKLNPTGTSLVACSYLGGTGDDLAFGLSINTDGQVVIGGYSNSVDFPIAGGGYPTNQGLIDAIVATLSSDLSSLAFSRYYGGTGNDYCYGLDTDVNGSIYICGFTGSTDLFLINPDQATNAGNGDAFIVRFRPNSDWILYASYVGTPDYDRMTSISCNNQGRAVTAGTVTIDAGSGLTELGYALVWDVCHEDFSLASVDSPTCEDSEVILESSYNDPQFSGQDFSWAGPNGFTSSDQNPVFNATSQSAGTYTVTVTDLGCTSTSEVTLAVDPALNTSIIGPGNVDPLTPTSFVVSQNLGSTYTWTVTNGTLISGQGTNSTSITFPIEGTATVMVTEVNGNCSETTSITVNVGCTSAPNPPAITGSATADENTTGAYSVPAQSGYSYTWTVSGGNIISGQGTNAISVQWGAAGAGSVSIIWADGNGCESNPATTSVTITGIVTPPPAQWITIATDPNNDGADPNAILMDGTLLEYKYIESNDSLYFRATVAAMSATNTQAAGMNVHLYYSGGGTTFDFWGDDNNATTNTLGWHRMLTTWVTGTPPTNYTGTIGIADAAGVASNNFTNVAQDNINVWIDQAAKTVTMGLLRADAIPNSAISSPVTVAAAVGSNEFWNDDIYLPAATINVGPQSIFDRPEAEELSIYPNPSNGLFGLDLSETEFSNAANVVVIDKTGRTVYQSMVTSNRMQIDLSNVATGIYMLQVREGNLLGASRIAVVQ